ncbi:acyl-CoA dehydrogenase [Myxococcota bacterium]|nr:acyl-CoA dehydrogenase [Myxococcota bacterium]
MPLVHSEEQTLLREIARDFISEKSPTGELRRLRDEPDPIGFSKSLWKEMAELGWAGIPFAEEFGGADLGHTELGVVLQECGRTLTASPLLSTIALGGTAIDLGASEALRKEVLTGVCSGQRILAVAHQEQTRHAPYATETRATKTPSGYTIAGSKTFVLDGHVADQLLVVARTSGSSRDRNGLSLFLVDAETPGITRTRTLQVDGRNAARIEFRDVEVDGQRLLGEIDRGAEILDPVLDRATAGLCAEMLGGIEAAFEHTLNYLKVREQFGTVIGSFQALKHRAAELHVEIELSRSIVIEVQQAIDSGDEAVPELVSTAKARLSETAFLMGNEGVQMLGGIGMTDEEDIGLYLKRFRVQQFTFGDASFHRDRYANLRGY